MTNIESKIQHHVKLTALLIQKFSFLGCTTHDHYTLLMTLSSTPYLIYLDMSQNFPLPFSFTFSTISWSVLLLEIKYNEHNFFIFLVAIAYFFTSFITI